MQRQGMVAGQGYGEVGVGLLGIIQLIYHSPS